VAGSVVLVTGASSGIGAATARSMGEAGAMVLLVARSEDGLHAVEREITGTGGSARVLPTDLCDSEATQTLIENVRRDHGGVDVLVNNAGRSIRRSIELSYDRFHDFQRTIDVNYLGPVRLVLGLLPAMRERGRGHIINVSSLGVLFSAPRFSAYLGSKSAFDAFLRCVAPEVRSDGVAITNIYMPLVRTPMMEPTQVWGWLPSLSPEGAAERICRAVVKRPVAMAPRLAKVGRIGQDLSPAGYEALLESVYRHHERPFSAEGGGVVDIEVPRIQFMLEQVGRVASWRRSKKT
jgi:NAD(P)-dependent dehydrogenase (short-subunit alcohol dehydrogenase family)